MPAVRENDNGLLIKSYQSPRAGLVQALDQLSTGAIYTGQHSHGPVSDTRRQFPDTKHLTGTMSPCSRTIHIWVPLGPSMEGNLPKQTRTPDALCWTVSRCVRGQLKKQGFPDKEAQEHRLAAIWVRQVSCTVSIPAANTFS